MKVSFRVQVRLVIERSETHDKKKRLNREGPPWNKELVDPCIGMNECAFSCQSLRTVACNSVTVTKTWRCSDVWNSIRRLLSSRAVIWPFDRDRLNKG